MNDQADENRVPLVRVDELIFVGLFSEMEVCSYGVLEEMNDQVAARAPERPRSFRATPRRREILDDGRGQHEACAECDEISKVGAIPMLLHNNGAAEDVGGCGREAEKQAENEIGYICGG